MRKPSHALVVSYAALFFALGGTAAAATGGTFTLGKRNLESTTSTLRSTTGTPLSLTAPAGHAPLAVSNTTTVLRLNADLLDGQHASAFLPANGTAVNANALGGEPASAFLPVGGTAANAQALNGLSAAAFLPVTATAANAQALGGLAASQYQQRVWQGCTGTKALQSVASDGSANCSHGLSGAIVLATNLCPADTYFIGTVQLATTGFLAPTSASLCEYS